MTTGQNIKASDYNAIRAKVEQILDTGGTTGSIRGYGQRLLSAPVNPETDIITRNQWEALRRDILNIKIHQENPVDSNGNTILPFVIPIPVDEAIRFGSSHPNTNFNNLIDQATVTSLQIAEGRSVVSSAVGSPVFRTLPWTTKVACEVTVNFEGFTRADGYVATPLNHARFFFNSGGRIRISSNRSGGSPTPQNNSWTALLVQAAIRDLAAKEPSTVNFYSLTDTYQTLYELSSSVPYAANSYLIEAKGDNFDPATLIPSTVIFKITWTDAYEDSFPSAPPPDLVDGTLSLFIEESKATGPVFNSITTALPFGVWVLPSPTYSITDIVDA
jgi:hypothetical protein